MHIMARSRRRSGRIQKTPDAAGATDDDAQPQPPQDGEDGHQDDDDRCPECKGSVPEGSQVAADKEKWVRCDACKTWFHWRCVGEGGDLDAVDKWSVLSLKRLGLCPVVLTLRSGD